jgi:hypothetical protein
MESLRSSFLSLLFLSSVQSRAAGTVLKNHWHPW